MPLRSIELLEKILAGEDITVTDVDQLVSEKVIEDLYLDYKHGNELLDRKKASQTIRQYVSSFANSSGGVLIIGVDEQNWQVTGYSIGKSDDLAMWASRCLTPIASYFSPPLIFQVVKHPQGDVLICAVARSIGLVPTMEGGEISHYFRFHDQTLNNKTLKAPEYLITDIVLGRRNRPFLTITEITISHISAKNDDHLNMLNIYVEPKIVIENQSLHKASEVRVGVIGWTNDTTALRLAIGNNLASYLDIKPSDMFGHPYTMKIQHFSRRENKIEALSVLECESFAQFYIPRRVLNTWYTYSWKGAIYIISEEIPPNLV